MLDAALQALQSLAQPSLLVMLLAGVLAGLVMGLIPGLGGTGAVAILLPITFGMDPSQAFALLIGALAVVHTSDTVSAVLLGAPGSASASVTRPGPRSSSSTPPCSRSSSSRCPHCCPWTCRRASSADPAPDPPHQAITVEGMP